VVLTGPTGVGKSALAAELAREISGEVINADSLAFYRGLDIGTAKPNAYERAMAPHHLLDVVEPDRDFTAADFLRLARPLIAELAANNRVPLVVGGTGLYLRSLLKGLFEGPARDEAFRASLWERAPDGPALHRMLEALDPLAAARLKPADRPRLERALEVLHLTGESILTHQARHGLSERPYDALTIIVDRGPEEMEARLAARTKAMYEGGLVEEVRALLARGYSPSLKPLRSVGYLEAAEVALGRLDRDSAEAATLVRTRQLAKRQRTWFRGQTPEGLWMEPSREAVVRVVKDFLAAP
jgi:tRNA dimethylallyltransferase